MEDARHNDRYTDVTLVAEGKHFKVHKVVLATQSSFFATRFEERWEKDGSNEIDMLDVPNMIQLDGKFGTALSPRCSIIVTAPR